VADTWQNQRWDSFRLNTPGWMNETLGTVEPTSFSYRDEVVRLLADRAASLPVHTNAPVVALHHDGSEFVVRTPDEEIRTATVVLANGLQNVAKQPAQADQLARRLFQIHTRDYRSAAQLPDGAVLVIGSAQSGSQIAEDLALAGRRVYLSTSRVGRYPWMYRGRQLIGWLVDCGFWDQRPEDLPSLADTRLPIPVVASGGRSLDLRILARLGVTPFGRFESADGERITFTESLAENVAYADAIATRLKGLADAFIARQDIDAPEAEPDLDTAPVEPGNTTELDLAAADVTSIIWCTGFTGDLSWVRLPILDGEGRPRHNGCASPVPGLWYAGFPWLTRRRSGILHGFPVDAADVTSAVARHLARRLG
ncbi:MAG: putative flavoprotein involved in transport, partial [Nocardioidaceae bacterium]|nr:putative flavoprotein involved in transport [Nocardioidaceae bacterium]